MTEDNIHIGRKGAMEYVLAVVTQFCNGSTDIIKAEAKPSAGRRKRPRSSATASSAALRSRMSASAPSW